MIIEEGDLDPWLYFLLSGKIRITKEGMEIGTAHIGRSALMPQSVRARVSSERVGKAA